MRYDRKAYFDSVRESLFPGGMSQDQVDGQEAILTVWEWIPSFFPDIALDERWLAYMLSTTYHETAQAMQPVEEYGKGEGMPYGEPDPETGQTYYGRGDVQLTWRDNYVNATVELKLAGDDDLEWHADRALDPVIAAKVMFAGMYQGWFRSDYGGRQTLQRYFNDQVDDAYGAREILNGDKDHVPDWSGGKTIGKLIAGYHDDFLAALANSAEAEPEPAPPIPTPVLVSVGISTPPGVQVAVYINGEQVIKAHDG